MQRKHTISLAQALDLISTDKREIPRAWQGEASARRAAKRIVEEDYIVTPATITAERLATIWMHNRG